MRLMVTWDHYEERLFMRSAMEWFCNVWLKIKCRDNGTESFILIYLRASSDMSFLNGKYERIHLIIVCFPHCVYMWLTVASPNLLAFSFWMQTSVHLGQYLSSDTGSGSPGCLGGGLFSHHLPGQTLGLEMVAKHPGGGGGAFSCPARALCHGATALLLYTNITGVQRCKWSTWNSHGRQLWLKDLVYRNVGMYAALGSTSSFQYQADNSTWGSTIIFCPET